MRNVDRRPSFRNPVPPSEILKVLVISVSHLLRVRVPPNVLLGVDVETLGIAWKPHGRDDGTLVSSVIDGIPIHAAKERVGFYFGGAAGDVAQAAGSVDRAELLDDVLCFGGEKGVRGEGYWLLDDSVGGGEMLVSCIEKSNRRGEEKRRGRKRTVCRSQLDSDAKRGDTRLGTRRSVSPEPTNPQPWCVPCFE